MACRKYIDLIPLVALGEAAASEKAAFEQHAASCAECRAELARFQEIVALLQARPADAPAPLESLRMENEILRRLTEESMRDSIARRRRAPFQTALRIAAALVLVAAGYVLRPSLSDLVTTPAPTAHATQSAADREDIRRAMKSGYRFSSEGLTVIARGAEALQATGDQRR